MRTGLMGSTECALCEMDSREVLFKPAGKWLEVTLDIFPKSEHIRDAKGLIDASFGFSGEILDFGHQVAYRPGSNESGRACLRFARAIRWA